MVNARAGIQRLRDRTDSLILLDNNRLLDLVPNLPVQPAVAVMDQLIGEVIKGITESITVPSLINLDFSDVRTILQSGGTSTVFYGENAENDPQRLVSETLNNPLLEVDYRGANGALIHISAGPGLRLRTAHEVVEGLTAAMRPDANVIFGVRVDPKYDGILRVLAIMTGVRSPMVESVRESISVADVVSDRSANLVDAGIRIPVRSWRRASRAGPVAEVPLPGIDRRIPLAGCVLDGRVEVGRVPAERGRRAPGRLVLRELATEEVARGRGNGQGMRERENEETQA